jgi:cellobiose phosphorylase
MNSLDTRLVDRERSLVKLLDPPFDKSENNPGYIQGYVPGVRENGGQYTHAAIWAAMAFAAQGDHRRAWELTSMINPVHHSSSEEAMKTYQVEPYVMAADIFAQGDHAGRGGWTWYTGSAGWMYRLMLESILGLSLEVDKLHFRPCLPQTWDGFKIHYRYRETVYHITVAGGSGTRNEAEVVLDGIPLEENHIPLNNDRKEHFVELTLGH